MKLNYLHLCENVVISNVGLVSAINIFDVLHVKNLPATHPKIVIAANFEITPNKENKLRVEIESPSGELTTKVGGIVASGKDKLNFSFEIFGHKFNLEGEYKFRLVLNDETLGETRLHVVKVTK